MARILATIGPTACLAAIRASLTPAPAPPWECPAADPWLTTSATQMLPVIRW